MTNSADSIERLIGALKTWPQSLPPGGQAPAGYLSRDFVAAFFLSVFIHVFLAFIAFLLWVVTTDPIAVEPENPLIATPLIVSLSMPAGTSRDGPDYEAVSAVPQSGPLDRSPQSSPERPGNTGRKSEAEIAVISKDRSIRDTKAFDGESPAAGTVPSFNLEAASRMASEFGRMPELKAETVAASKGRGGPGLVTPGGNSLAAYSTPAFGLEAADRIDRVFGKISEFEVQDPGFKTRRLYIKKYMAVRALLPDCRTIFANNGLFAVPFLIKNAITHDGCKWLPEIREIK